MIQTQDPEGLKRRIISDVESGNLPTWELRTNQNNDKLLTHSGDQWADVVLLRLTPDVNTQQLVIEPRHWSSSPKPSEVEKGTVLGRFCERLFIQYAQLIKTFIGEVN